MPWNLIGIFLIVSAALCAIGFYKYVYFMSVGYGLSVAGLGVAYLVALVGGGYSWNWVTVLQCLLFVAYGVRLSGFLIVREWKNASYRKVLKQATKEDEKPMPFLVKLVMWVCMAVLYVMQTSAVFFRGYNGLGGEVVLPLVGFLISLAGLVIESIADAQKSAQKKVEPNMVATKGLYKMVRCPNYFGELLFWTGVFVGALDALQGAWQWTIVVLGYVMIIAVMFNGAQRLDRRQEGNYGDRPEYRAYADHTPIIIPLVPLYHIGKYKQE